MDTYNEYKRIHYTLAPSGRYVGWTYYDNAIYYASHRTIELMAQGVKHQLYLQKKVSTRGYMIDINETPKDQVPIDKMRQGFLTRAYWGTKTTSKLTPEQKKIHERSVTPKKPTPVVPDEIKYDYYDYRQEGDKLIVIGCRKIAEYNLQKPVKQPDAEPDVEKVCINETLHLPNLN